MDRPLQEFAFRGRACYRSGKRGEEHDLLPIDTVITVRAPTLHIARQLVPSGLRHLWGGSEDHQRDGGDR